MTREGYQAVTPRIVVTDVDALLKFLRAVFGADIDIFAAFGNVFQIAHVIRPE